MTRIRTAMNAADIRNGNAEWFKFQNFSGGETRIDIFSEISWFGITAADFNRELKGIPASNSISLHINSPGGDVFDGIAIYNSLKQHQATVNVTVDGVAASIASVIAMAGDTVTMSQGALMMIHKPFAMTIGDDIDHEKGRNALRLMGDSIAGIYAARAGGEVEHWLALMTAETWYGDADAVAAGLADSVGGQAAAKNTFDLSIFRNGPRATTPSPDGPVINLKVDGAVLASMTEKPAQPETDWRIAARRQVAAAQMEVIHGYGH